MGEIILTGSSGHEVISTINNGTSSTNIIAILACVTATINSVANNIAIGAFSADAADMVLAA